MLHIKVGRIVSIYCVVPLVTWSCFRGYKMSGGDTSFGQSAATGFLVKQEIPQSDIRGRLKRAHGDAYMGASGVRR